MTKPIHTVKHVQKLSLPNKTTPVLETLIRQATSLRGKTGTVTITARLFPHPRHGTECFDFSIGIKKRSLSDYERRKIFSEVVDSTTKYERVGLLFTLEQVLTGILISFRGDPFALWDGQRFHALSQTC